MQLWEFLNVLSYGGGRSSAPLASLPPYVRLLAGTLEELAKEKSQPFRPQ